MKASLKNYRQSPRKVRLVADLIKGKSVEAADQELSFLVKRAALPFQKLLASAVANARQNFGVEKDNLIVSDVRVDKGVVLKRFMPRAMGRASRINKRSSHVLLVLSEKGTKKSETRNPKSETKAKTEKAPKSKSTVTKAKKPAKKLETKN